MPSPSKQILIPVDFSEQSKMAMESAIPFCELADAGITILYVDNNKELSREEAEVKLKEVCKEYEGKGIKTIYRIEKGKVANILLKVAKEIHPAFIVIGLLQKEGSAEFIGSMTFRVLSRSDYPVLSVNKFPDRPIKNIVVPIDMSKASRQKIGSCIKIANHFNAELKCALLLHDGANYMKPKIIAIGKMVAKLLKERNISYSMEIIRGAETPDMLKNYAKQVDADLVVIMTQEELSMMEYFVGTEAQEIISKTDIPVISFRPKNLDGFAFF